ncbi:MAG: PASTA domain-containing protein [Ruminococcaceae bacterium]|nr:PASTA domain-containing protein [Oscillospiraceae bacterium]
MRELADKKTASKQSKDKNKKKSVGTSVMMRRRMLILAFGMFALYLVVVGVMAWYQLVVSEKYQKMAVEQQLSDTELPADRGTIYDRNMETLVQSAPAWVVTVRPNDILPQQEDAIAIKLSQTLGLSEEYVRGRMNLQYEKDGKLYKYNEVKLKVKADKEQKDEILAFLTDPKTNKIVVEGVKLSADTKRYYFRGTLASTILGFTGTDNQGLAGLELYYDTTLSGVPGRIVSSQNAVNGEMPFDYKLLVDAQQGNSLVLTLDANIQTILEKYLVQAVRDNNVKERACGIIMNVNTGAIYAMATIPDYDPANPNELDESTMAALETLIGDERTQALTDARLSQWRNKAISDTYEPGSVFKPVTMAAALEEGLTSVNDSFYCSGGLNFGKRRISCHKSAGHGAESLTKGMMNSCNPVFMTLASRLGGTLFSKYYTAFGFTEKTGIDLPAEGVGVYHSAESLNAHPADLAVSSFGQTNTVTPIQMATAIAAVSNGGYLVTPHVVGQVLDEDGNIVETTETSIKRQVISNETSDIINSMLEQTVSGGTAKNGYISGYRLGGKTGTSEKISQNAQTGTRTYVASFCAIAPADDPEIVMLVMLDNPQGPSHMGGTIAAPVARNVLKEVLPYLGVETIYSADDVKLIDTLTPNVVQRTRDEAKAELSAKGLKMRIIGNGDTVVSQVPAAGSSIPKEGTVVVMTEETDMLMTTVPNVMNMTPTQANSAIKNAGLNIRYSGTGYDSSMGIVVAQDIPRGQRVAQGTVITVEFIMGGATD